jgi:hypothetical protein
MTRLSTLQYNMLRHFADQPITFVMSVQQAQTFDQRPFRSMLIQGWISYRMGRGFHISRKGREAWRDFQNHNIQRKNPNLPLTAYFDSRLYGLDRKPPAAVKRRLHVVAA